MSIGGSDSLGIIKGCRRWNLATCLKPKPMPALTPDMPRAPENDPWDGEDVPTSAIPVACNLTRSVLEPRGKKYKPIPDIEANGYTLENKAATSPSL